MFKERVLTDTCPAEDEPGSNGRGLADGRTPGEIIPAREVQLVDKHLDFHREQQIRRTAPKQARKEIVVYRQREIDSFGVEQALGMYDDLVAKTIKHMEDLYQFRDACLATTHPDLAARIKLMVDTGLDILQELPEKGVKLFLRRCALD
jgi:hypothetical protein